VIGLGLGLGLGLGQSEAEALDAVVATKLAPALPGGLGVRARVSAGLDGRARRRVGRGDRRDAARGPRGPRQRARERARQEDARGLGPDLVRRARRGRGLAPRARRRRVIATGDVSIERRAVDGVATASAGSVVGATLTRDLPAGTPVGAHDVVPAPRSRAAPGHRRRSPRNVHVHGAGTLELAARPGRARPYGSPTPRPRCAARWSRRPPSRSAMRHDAHRPGSPRSRSRPAVRSTSRRTTRSTDTSSPASSARAATPRTAACTPTARSAVRGSDREPGRRHPRHQDRGEGSRQPPADTKLDKSDATSYGVPDALGFRVRAQEEVSIDRSVEAVRVDDRPEVHRRRRHDPPGQRQRDLPVRVVEVLPSGDLFVEGTKVVMVGAEEHHIYMSGIVRRIDIADDDSVPSSRYRGRRGRVHRPRRHQRHPAPRLARTDREQAMAVLSSRMTCLAVLLGLLASSTAEADRIKDLTTVAGVRANHLTGSASSSASEGAATTRARRR